MTVLPVAADHDYPQMIAETNHVEPAPRRVRATLGGEQIFDTTRARYVWEWPYYPQYYIPADDIDPRFLVDEHHEQRLRQGTARRHGLRAGGLDRPGTVRVFGDDAINGVAGTARFNWDALDAWYEEDEQVFVHPRNPYARVDALRSTRRVRVELEGEVLAESSAPVMVFETGLPTRYYLNRTEVDLERLVASDTVTACPYKGRARYYTAKIGDQLFPDIVWSYPEPIPECPKIKGYLCFFNEQVDAILVDGVDVPRPVTPWSKDWKEKAATWQSNAGPLVTLPGF